MFGRAADSDDRREHARQSCEIQTTCQPPSAWCNDPWPVVICDISVSGMSLRLARRFERGSGLAIELPTDDGGTKVVLARITHVEPGEGCWILGCAFISELSDDEVQSVLNLDPHRRSGSDTPQALCRPAPSINGVVFQTKFNGEVLRWFVRRLDLSSNWPIPYGKVVAFQVGGADPEVRADLTILNCRRIGSYWIVDCRFLHDVPDKVIHILTSPACV